MKKLLTLTSIIALALSLTSCGGSGGGLAAAASRGEYCDSVQEYKKLGDAMDFTDTSTAGYLALLDAVDDVESNAPDQIKSAWHTLAGYLSGYSQAITDAGLTFDELQRVGFQKLLRRLSQDQLDQITASLKIAETPKIQAAGTAIQLDAMQRCNISGL